MRIAFCFEYDGSRFHGFQYQNASLRTVQSVLEEALSKVADSPVSIVAAGRTDQGVHALNQIAHFDTEIIRPDKAWVLGGNTYLPSDISIKWAKVVGEKFHARFSALSRHYRYILYHHPIRPAIHRNYVGWYYQTLNEQLMQESAQSLLGEHDFSSFRGADCQAKSPIRKIFNLKVRRAALNTLDKKNRSYVIIDIIANAFLHHMVRNIVGTLILVGSGEKRIEYVKEVLEQRDRSITKMTVSPNGLFLMKIRYPKKYGI